MPDLIDQSPATGRGPWMQTFTGAAFYLLNPRPEEINPVDIAHALGNLCRYSGAVTCFYSVAEHCWLMSHAVSPPNALPALLHDATEAYLGDVIAPLKLLLPQYRGIEDRLAGVIGDRFRLPRTLPVEVKHADRRILLDERAAVMADPQLPWQSTAGLTPLGVRVRCWDPVTAKTMFLQRLAELGAAAEV